MKQGFLAAIALCGLSISVCMAQEQRALTQEQELETAKSATAAFSTYAGYLKAGNFTEVLKFYSDDPRFYWVEDGNLKYDSKDQVARAFDALSKMGTVENQYGAPSVTVLSENHASVFVKFRTTINKDTDKAFSFAGAVTIVMEKAPAGWRFLIGHSSTASSEF